MNRLLRIAVAGLLMFVIAIMLLSVKVHYMTLEMERSREQSEVLAQALERVEKILK